MAQGTCHGMDGAAMPVEHHRPIRLDGSFLLPISAKEQRITRIDKALFNERAKGTRGRLRGSGVRKTGALNSSCMADSRRLRATRM